MNNVIPVNLQNIISIAHCTQVHHHIAIEIKQGLLQCYMAIAMVRVRNIVSTEKCIASAPLHRSESQQQYVMSVTESPSS